ncbi:MAG: DnaJ domain-containing protein [Pseudomonadota bacterium]
MELPQFDSSKPSQNAAQAPIRGIAAVVRARLSGRLTVTTGPIVRELRFDAGNCLEASAEAIVKELAPLSNADLTFTPGSSMGASKSKINGLRLLISAASALDPAQMAALFPELKSESFVRYDAKRVRSLEPLPLEPEERGLVTVLEHSRVVAHIFESSFLPRPRVQALVFAYWLGGFCSFEDPAEVKRKEYINSLKPEAVAIREEVRQRVTRLSATSYYDWLEVPPTATATEIQKKGLAIYEKYLNPALEQAFQDERKGELAKLLAALVEARGVLTHADKRAEYDGFLAAGRTGSFVRESRAVRSASVIGKAETEIAAGDPAAAVARYESALTEGAVSPKVTAAYARALLADGGPGNTKNREKALAHLKKSLAETPSDPDLYLAYAEWCEALRQTDRAAEGYQRALSLDPTIRAAREGLHRLKPEQAPKMVLSAIHRNLGRLTRYQLLGVAREANLREIHASYRELTGRYHPDRFFGHPDGELQSLAKETFKRMVDAFMTLKSPEKRKAYDAELIEISRQAPARS